MPDTQAKHRPRQPPTIHPETHTTQNSHKHLGRTHMMLFGKYTIANTELSPSALQTDTDGPHRQDTQAHTNTAHRAIHTRINHTNSSLKQHTNTLGHTRATQTYRITPNQHTQTTLTENTHTHTQRYTTHKQHPLSQARRTQRTLRKHTGTGHTLRRGHSPNIPRDRYNHSPQTPAQTRSQTPAHTQARHLQIHNPAHARSHGGPRRPPCAVTAPPTPPPPRAPAPPARRARGQ